MVRGKQSLKSLVDIMALRTGMNHCSGRDLGDACDGVAQRKLGWTYFNGKINSRGKPVLLFLFSFTAADTSGRCRKLPPNSCFVQGNLWHRVQGQRKTAGRS